MSSDVLLGRFSIGELIKAGAISAHKDGNFGSLYPRIDDFVDDGIPLLTAKVVNAGRIDFDAAQRLSREKAAKLPYGFIQADDVLLSHNATVGRVAVVPKFNGQAMIGTSLTYFRLDSSRLLPRYLACFFESRDFQNQLAGVMGLSTRNQVPITAQRLLAVEVPPLTVQRELSAFVGAIDDRITLLRETNATLEGIAQALFKSWFVDFEPVRAKMEGRTPEGMDEATAALFPDSFEESELGLVPRGWRLTPFGELLTHTIGGDWGSDVSEGANDTRVAIIRGTDIPDLQSGAMSRVPVRYTSTKKLATRKLEHGDIVLEVSGGSKDQPTGRALYLTNGLLGQFDCPVEPASFCRLLRPCTNDVGVLLTQHLTYIYAQGKTWEYQNQSTGIANFQTTHFLATELVAVSSEAVLSAFADVVRPLIDRTHLTQIKELATLRDTLLPRLISGQLRLPEAQANAEDALV